MKDYHLILLGFGLATVSMAYLPIITERLKVTYTLPMLLIGALLFHVGVPVDWPEPFWEHQWVKVVTELVVILSLMSAGLKIGFRYGREHWKNPLRLIHTTMPVYILGIFAVAYYLVGLDGPSALLLAAVCAPTDPVMATDMQLEGEGEGDQGGGHKNTGLRYLLTSEAGLNDGMAFPFVFLAILWADAGNFGEIDFVEWTTYYLLFKIIVGALIGSLFGLLYSYTIDRLHSAGMGKALSGFVAIALAVASFALAETASSYGFLSVFFTGLFAQYHHHTDEENSSKDEMLLYSEETEKLIMVVFIVLFGGFLANGILTQTSWSGILAALAIVVLLRPLTGILAMVGLDYSPRKKWAVAFFGIKGVGSFFYLAYGLNEGTFNGENELYAIVSWVVLISVIIHGLSGPRVVKYFERNNPG